MKINALSSVISTKNNFKTNKSENTAQGNVQYTNNDLKIVSDGNYGRAQILFGSSYIDDEYIETEEDIDNAKIETISKNLNIPLSEAARYYDGYIKKYSDKNFGLGAVKGFSLEKYRLAMDVIKPIARVHQTKKRSDMQYVPCGVLLYAPPSSGKVYISEKLCENLNAVGANILDVEFDVDDEDENIRTIYRAFNEAQRSFEETGKYSVINFVSGIDGLGKDAEEILMNSAQNCSYKGVVWVSSTAEVQKHNPVLYSDRIATVVMPVVLQKPFDYEEIIYYLLEQNNKKEKSLNFFDMDMVLTAIRLTGSNLTMGELSKVVKAAVDANSRNNRLADTDTFIEQLTDFCGMNRLHLNNVGKEQLKKDAAFIKHAKETYY